MKAYFAYLVAAPLALCVGSALAGEPVDNSSLLLAKARYQAAVAELEPQLRRDPADELVALNLALAYRHVGRVEEARRLYLRVLNRDNVELTTQDGRTLASHAIARAALAAMPQFSAR